MLAAPNRSDSRHFPAADDCVFSRVHVSAKLFALAKRHVVGVADRKAVAKVRVDVASLSVGVVSNLRVILCGPLGNSRGRDRRCKRRAASDRRKIAFPALVSSAL